jgi:DNA polymerase III epsilon subunit-like protein
MRKILLVTVLLLGIGPGYIAIDRNEKTAQYSFFVMFWKRIREKTKLNLLLFVLTAFILTCCSVLACATPDVLISEISPHHPEFIELYNPTDQVVNLEGLYFAYYPSDRDSWENPYRAKPFPATAAIQPNRYFLIGIGGNTSDCLTPDWIPYTSKMIRAERGTVALLDGEPGRSNLVDAVGWGNTHLYLGAPAIAAPEGWALTRKPGSSEDEPFQYKTDNSLDFSVMPPSPSSSSTGALFQMDSVADGNETLARTLIIYSKSPTTRTLRIQVESNIGLQTIAVPHTVELKPDECAEILIVPGMYEFYSFDLETSGLDPKVHSIIEVGWVHFHCGKITEEYSSLVRYEEELDPFITFLTGITSEMLQPAPLPENVIPGLLDRFNEHPVIFYSNTRFDERFLQPAAESLGLELRYIQWISAYPWAKRALPDLASHKLERVVEELDIGHQNHRALPDARITGVAFLEFLKRVGAELIVHAYPIGCEHSAAVIALPIDISLLICQ